MKPHKHAELIKAWADGAEIQQYRENLDEWRDCSPYPAWDERLTYRIKPEPKPDMKILYEAYKGNIAREGDLSKRFCMGFNNLILTFDGETGELKSAEVLK
jgi:hypothetical protein